MSLFVCLLRLVEVKGKRAVVLFLLLGVCPFVPPPPSQAQESFIAFTLLYSNNINGEIDPCPS